MPPPLLFEKQGLSFFTLAFGSRPYKGRAGEGSLVFILSWVIAATAEGDKGQAPLTPRIFLFPSPLTFLCRKLFKFCTNNGGDNHFLIHVNIIRPGHENVGRRRCAIRENYVSSHLDLLTLKTS